MKPINFKEQNKTFTKPETMTDEECGSLPVYQNHEQIISCWKLSEEELAQVLKTKKVWLHCFAQFQVPVYLGTEFPFISPTVEDVERLIEKIK